MTGKNRNSEGINCRRQGVRELAVSKWLKGIQGSGFAKNVLVVLLKDPSFGLL